MSLHEACSCYQGRAAGNGHPVAGLVTQRYRWPTPLDMHRRFEYEEALFCLDALPGEAMPDIACRMLEAGLDSQPLRELAGLASPTIRDAGPLFAKVLRLLRPEPMHLDRAREIVGVRVLEDIATGAVAPLAGAQEISRRWDADSYPSDLSVFVYLADTVDARRVSRAAVEREIVDTARALLAKRRER